MVVHLPAICRDFLFNDFPVSIRKVIAPGSQQPLDIILVNLPANLPDTFFINLLDTGNKTTRFRHKDGFIRLMVVNRHNIHRPASNIHHQHLVIKALHPVRYCRITLRINRNPLHRNMVLYFVITECDFPLPQQIFNKAVLFLPKTVRGSPAAKRTFVFL